MEDEEGGLPKLSKRFADKGGEVDYNTKSGTAWSHSYLNQKPWHPLSYPNQRRKWIAEQTHAQRERRAEEVAREYAQEQDFLRQTSLLSQKEKEKVDMMQAVSFMYVRPPGYNAESAKAAEIVDEQKKTGESDPLVASTSSGPQEAASAKDEKKKPRPKDVFGRALPSEEEFAILKNAPKLETGVAGRAKPFAVEVRNVKCVRCGTFGHQSGDRECPLKDAIMPNDESRLKRDDPLTTIMAQMDPSEPLKWELKQKAGISPPRGGFKPDDPNQQIVAEDIFDEYGGFLSGGNIPELLTSFSFPKDKKEKSKSKRKHKKQRSSRRSHEDDVSTSDGDNYQRLPETKLISKSKHKKQTSSRPNRGGHNSTSDSDSQKSSKRKLNSKHKHKSRAVCSDSGGDSTPDKEYRRKSRKEHRHESKDRKHLSRMSMSEDSDSESEKYSRKSGVKHSHQVDHIDPRKDRNCQLPGRTESRANHERGLNHGERKPITNDKKQRNHKTTQSMSVYVSSDNLEADKKSSRKGRRHRTSGKGSEYSSSDDSELERHHRKHKYSHSSRKY